MSDNEPEDELERYKAKAQEKGLPFVDLSRVAADPSAVNLVPGHIAKRHRVLPVRLDNNILWVAMSDTSNPYAADDLRAASGCSIRPVMAAPGALDEAIRQNYG